MLYILFGPQGLILENQCRKILKENLTEIDDFHCVKFSALETPIEDIVNEAELPSLTGERKAIVVYNSFFLMGEKPKDRLKVEHDFDILKAYLENPNQDTDLIFICEGDKLLEKSELVKILRTKAKIIEAKEITKEEWPIYIQKYFKRLQVLIDYDAVEELSLRVQGDALRFTNEAKKLALYSDHITLQDVEMMVARPLEDNAFSIFDCLLKNKKGQALKIYRDLAMENVEPVSLISLIAGQFRLLSEIDYLNGLFETNYDISKALGVHEYRVKLGREHLRRNNIQKILKALDQLYTLDYQIKSGQVDRFYALEMFILNF